MCTLCGSHRLLFEPLSLYCSGACGMQKIRRNAIYYTDRTKQNHWCASCYLDLVENDPIVLEDGNEVRKDALQKLKNDDLPEESWVQCDECNGWVHQICALFNGRRNKSSTAYICPKCHIEKAPQGETIEVEKRVKVAKDLPHCRMSAEIENGLNRILMNAYEDRAKELGIDVSGVEKAEGLSVRVISNMEKNHLVRDEVGRQRSKLTCLSHKAMMRSDLALYLLLCLFLRCSNDTPRRVHLQHSRSGPNVSLCSKPLMVLMSSFSQCMYTNTTIRVHLPIAGVCTFHTWTLCATLSRNAIAQSHTTESLSNTCVMSRSVGSTLLTFGAVHRHRAMIMSSTAIPRISSFPVRICFASGISACWTRQRQKELCSRLALSMMNTSRTTEWMQL